jgi:hypothetical protein
LSNRTVVASRPVASKSFARPVASAALLFGGTLGVHAAANAGVVAFGGSAVAYSWVSMGVSACNPSTGYSDSLVQ